MTRYSKNKKLQAERIQMLSALNWDQMLRIADMMKVCWDKLEVEDMADMLLDIINIQDQWLKGTQGDK